jgi:predicted AAA+ superfamily ATPase
MKNHDYVNKGFRHTLNALAPYLMRELKAEYGDKWWEYGVLDKFSYDQMSNLPTEGDDEELIQSLDVLKCLQLIDRQWNEIFKKKLSNSHRSWANELIAVRNKWAHIGQKDFSETETRRALDTMSFLVDQIDDGEKEQIDNLLRTAVYGSAEGSKKAVIRKRPIAVEPPKNAGIMREVTQSGLKPWREIIDPHPDVATNQYKNAEFAADLSQVARGEGSLEYRDPIEFFNRTYVTTGMKGLLVEAIKRVTGKGGEPVVQLKTAFGGGKTHSMLALYHLLRGKVSLETIKPSIGEVLKEAQVSSLPRVHVAVIVGTALNPAVSKRPPNMPGITINTLWGEIAAQLAESMGDRSLYDYVKKADSKGVSPGSEALTALFNRCGSCMILVDELVAYGKKLYGVEGLPAGTYDNFIAFIQELTEAASNSKSSIVVASLPESDLEIGGEAGQQVLKAIEHIYKRKESIWKPVGAEEGFEVVRRRLFGQVKDEEARDRVCSAFLQMYRDSSQDFPLETKELDYKERMISCYPIHPEVFDRLYDDWSTLESFQRTRGVLRLLAAVVYDLWIKNDQSLLIMPASLSLDTPDIKNELTRYLPDTWNSVIERDVDGLKSVPFKTDQKQPRFGKSLASRRIARTIFLGSAPSVRQMNVRGIEQARIRLGVVQPGEQIAIFNDALNTLRNSLTYLYSNHDYSRFWYDTRPTLRKMMLDRSTLVSDADVILELESRLRKLVKTDPFQSVHSCPSSSADIPDEQILKLVILSPKYSHAQRENDSSALTWVTDALNNRGGAPRQYKNMLAFVCADASIYSTLYGKVKEFIAWQTIQQEEENLSLEPQQKREITASIREGDNTINLRLNDLYSWLLLPTIDLTKKSHEIEWEIQRISGSDGNCVSKAARKMIGDESAITKWAPILLLQELDRLLWKDRDSIQVKELWENFCKYCYLPRLSDINVLEDCIKEGVKSDAFFGLASNVEDESYINVRFNQSIDSVHQSDYLIRATAAEEQKTKEPIITEEGGGVKGSETLPGTPLTPPPMPLPDGPTHFYLSTEIDPTRYVKTLGLINEEILSHLFSLKGSKVKIMLEVQADFDEEVPSDTIRTVKENSATLKIDDCDFSEN